MVFSVLNAVCDVSVPRTCIGVVMKMLVVKLVVQRVVVIAASSSVESTVSVDCISFDCVSVQRRRSAVVSSE